jgi:hypothetical protein
MDTTAQEQQYIILSVDGILLCFAKREGTLIDLASVIQEYSYSNSRSVGLVTHEEQQWPAYSLNSDFSFQPAILDENRFCINFAVNSDRPYALLCNTVTSIKSISDLSPIPLPSCMKTSLSPVSQLFFYENEMVYLLDQDKTRDYINNMDKNHGEN